MMVKLKANTQLLRFAMVGILNTLVDFGLFNLLVLIAINQSEFLILSCNAVSFLSANICSYFCNRNWTFNSGRSANLGEYGSYLSISVVGLVLNCTVMWILTQSSDSSFVNLNLSKVGATIASMIWNYCGYRILLTPSVSNK